LSAHRIRHAYVTAATLLICGEHDREYPPDIAQQTADRIPHAQFILYKGRNHRSTLTDRRLLPDIMAFLTPTPMNVCEQR
jgi:pimeloyl-ACP methyl ester carboxylesterase